MPGKAILQVVLLSLGISIFAIFAAKSPMLGRLRGAVDRKSPWAGYAAGCAFCIAGWTALLLNSIYRPWLLEHLFDASLLIREVNALAPINFMAGWLSLWGLATLFYRILWPFLERHAPKMRIRWSRR